MVKLSVCICISGDRVGVRAVCEMNFIIHVENTIEGTVVDGVTVKIALIVIIKVNREHFKL